MRCANAASSTSRCAAWTSIRSCRSASPRRRCASSTCSCCIACWPTARPTRRRRSPRSARNQHRTAARGREPGLRLERGGARSLLTEWGGEMLDACAPIAARARRGARRPATTRDAVASARRRCCRTRTMLPSARVLRRDGSATTAARSSASSAPSRSRPRPSCWRCRSAPRSRRGSTRWRSESVAGAAATSRRPTRCRSRSTAGPTSTKAPGRLRRLASVDEAAGLSPPGRAARSASRCVGDAGSARSCSTLM